MTHHRKSHPFRNPNLKTGSGDKKTIIMRLRAVPRGEGQCCTELIIFEDVLLSDALEKYSLEKVIF